MKTKQRITSLCAGLLASTGFSQTPHNVIMYIGDGFGIAPKTAARMAMGQGTTGKVYSSDPGFRVLALDNLKYTSNLTTHSQNSWITDSGPGASVYACGKNGKIDNESIAFSVSGDSAVTTILELAKKMGYAVGLVTTTRITHATPAAFGSHIWFRDLEDYIASQYISSNENDYEAIYNDNASTIKPYNASRDWQLPTPKVGVEIDVLLGGGFRHFFPNNVLDTVKTSTGAVVMNAGVPVTLKGKRSDNVNLVSYAEQRGYKYINSRDALINLNLSQFTATNNTKLIGLFNGSHMNYEQDRQTAADWEPSLFEMTQMAIEVLKIKGGSKGFFLLVEGGRIDHLSHANAGGISVIAGPSGNQYTVDSDKEAYSGGGDGNYSATPTTTRQTSVYGSDYMIKEVLAFDYSVQQGRNLLNDPNSKTLIFSSSDHECGGAAVVGLHDENDAQGNGTKVRTYALTPQQNGIGASSGGPASANTVATPSNLGRGDVNFGASNPGGWYPDYTTTTFQGRPELWPVHTALGRRIVISYGSNPLTNGNGQTAGGTPGNHTPQDVWVGGDDNDGGVWASRITGKGLLDNTDLTKVMADFLTIPFVALGVRKINPENSAGAVTIYPNPMQNEDARITISLETDANVTMQLFNVSGSKLGEMKNIKLAKGDHNYSVSDFGARLPGGIYLLTTTINDHSTTNKIITVQ